MEYRCRPPEPPLPPIRIERKNPEYARLLLADYAGKAGEFTASTQYIYQAFITHQSHPRLSEDLEHISIAEMRHMERLGKLIVLLGGNPLLRTCPMGGCCYWEAPWGTLVQIGAGGAAGALAYLVFMWPGALKPALCGMRSGRQKTSPQISDIKSAKIS